MKDKQYLYTMYNATSTDDGTGEIETYENWLERQLLSRIEKLEALEKANGQESEQRQLTIPGVSGMVCSTPELQPIECERWRGCYDCPKYVKQT